MLGEVMGQPVTMGSLAAQTKPLVLLLHSFPGCRAAGRPYPGSLEGGGLGPGRGEGPCRVYPPCTAYCYLGRPDGLNKGGGGEYLRIQFRGQMSVF